MKYLTKRFAGQSFISWGLQLLLIYLAWLVTDHKIQNNLWTIGTTAILVLLIYMSLAHDNHSRTK
ncbi:hypothetical protein LL940_11885 [Levilactobacillus brevis]|uniref:hypothetical protein n=1 Tax=Levilactobacillus brevis TaxID=1580 RepID=UPI001C1EA2B2|nr:hypothetical protein [Levilactobacillus brevis]MBU7560118.1 hypothetical protein [Levilactobacillus brevis]MCE6026265.1 hypothetical protein [Levilactobacillus brevis]